MENKDFEQSEESKMKKIYSTPKIEAIGDVRDATRGAKLGTTDTDGAGGPPYQPGG